MRARRPTGWLLLLLLGSASVAKAERVVCSFNIQFLGNAPLRDASGLARLLSAERCDLVVVQELVAPPAAAIVARTQLTHFDPLPGEAFDELSAADQKLAGPRDQALQFPRLGNRPPVPLRASEASTRFFEAMAEVGFGDFILSEEKTGPKTTNTNANASEWWVVFFKKDRVRVAPDLPHGFLSDVRVKHPDFERVPYAFPFRSQDDGFDFVIISTHLKPDDGPKARARRGVELAAIRRWINTNSGTEKDFVVLGDMNIEDAEELGDHLDAEADPWDSLNAACVATNTASNGKPYDHVLIARDHTSEAEVPPAVESRPNFTVVNLRDAFRAGWPPEEGPYPGGTTSGAGYDHNKFRARYSDHHPVRFVIHEDAKDDDGH